MNEKQLAQIDAWLHGQHRYKLLDREQTGILKLKGARSKSGLHPLCARTMISSRGSESKG
jgi:antibiotic biosynthesis monooxygenase (ABM) superfamily enzyme